MADTALHIPRSRRQITPAGWLWISILVFWGGGYGLYRLVRWLMS